MAGRNYVADMCEILRQSPHVAKKIPPHQDSVRRGRGKAVYRITRRAGYPISPDRRAENVTSAAQSGAKCQFRRKDPVWGWGRLWVKGSILAKKIETLDFGKSKIWKFRIRLSEKSRYGAETRLAACQIQMGISGWGNSQQSAISSA